MESLPPLSLVFYGLSLIMMVAIAFSYGIAYYFSRSIGILALTLFFVANSIIELMIVLHLLEIHDYVEFSFDLSTGVDLRAAILFIATTFLFITTWLVKGRTKG